MEDYLKSTKYIDKDHPTIRAVLSSTIKPHDDQKGKALALFNFVRSVPFGFSQGFWENKASDVIKSGRGYCNTKSTLLIALLRAAGIPARQYFVEIDAKVLHGILDPGTAMVDHSYVEVLLDGRWIATDAYIVDPPLFRVAQKRLVGEGHLLGYGAHATGTNGWDGISPSFSQYNILDKRPIGSRKWGVYADVGDFYARAPDPHNRLNVLMRAGFGFLVASANRRADDLRKEIYQ